jgi:hypothetical protein
MRRTNRPAWAILIAIALIGTACTGGDDDDEAAGSAGSTSGAAAGGPLDLKSVCPDPMVVQKVWQPESEHGFLYNLVGPAYTIDAEKMRVTSPLVSQGRDTGVRIQIRTGGPAVGLQPVP